MLKNILIFLSISILLSIPAKAECIKGDCKNNIGTKIYGKDIKYVGGFKNGLFDGKGIYEM